MIGKKSLAEGKNTKVYWPQNGEMKLSTGIPYNRKNERTIHISTHISQKHC